MQLPMKHCAFKGCLWRGMDDVGLQNHVWTAHKDELEPVALLLPQIHSEEERYMAAYHEGIAVVVRSGAPLATYSIDRRCLYNYTQTLSGDGVQSLVCFCCARRFPYVPSWSKNEIRWITPLDVQEACSRTQGDVASASDEWFCGLGREEADELFGL